MAGSLWVQGWWRIRDRWTGRMFHVEHSSVEPISHKSPRWRLRFGIMREMSLGPSFHVEHSGSFPRGSRLPVRSLPPGGLSPCAGLHEG